MDYRSEPVSYTHLDVYKRQAVRRADFILPAVAFVDGAGLVIIHHEMLLKAVVNFGCAFRQLFGKRQHGAFKRRQRRMQVQDNARIVLLRVDDLFIIGIHQEGEGHAVGAERRFNNIGDRCV